MSNIFESIGKATDKFINNLSESVSQVVSEFTFKHTDGDVINPTAISDLIITPIDNRIAKVMIFERKADGKDYSVAQYPLTEDLFVPPVGSLLDYNGIKGVVEILKIQPAKVVIIINRG